MKIGVCGLGRLGKAVVSSAEKEETEIVGVFTRRDPRLIALPANADVYGFEYVSEFQDKIDVMINCMGSDFDLPVTSAYLSQFFNLVDPYQNKKDFGEHLRRCNRYALKGRKLCLVGAGTDPGLFSLLKKICKEFNLPDIMLSVGRAEIKDIYEFTANAMLCFSKAVYSMNKKGKSGAISVFELSLEDLLINKDFSI